VNRGNKGVETISLLLSYKVRFPKRITLLRGSGECRQMTQVYRFYDECMGKYGNANVWRSFTDIFDYLPLAAIVENSFYCIHSGLSPEIDRIDQLKSLDRVQELPIEGPLKDILWSEPGDGEGWSPIPRSCGYYFGEDMTEKFNYRNNIKMICRGHRLAMQGYSLDHSGLVATICSARYYYYEGGNLPAVLELDDTLDMNFIQFEAAPRYDKEAARRVPGHFLGRE